MKQQLKQKKVKKLSITKVQLEVNKAIRETDETCLVRDGRHECCGNLTASHFFAVGGNSTFRFYPPNIHCQCFGHHGIHERKQDPFFYRRWMEEHYPEELEWMERNFFRVLRYNQDTLREIHALAKALDIGGLTKYVRSLIEQG